MKISAVLSVVATAASTTAPIVHAFVASPLSAPGCGQAATLGSRSSIVSSSSPKNALIATQHHHGRGVFRMVSGDGGSSPGECLYAYVCVILPAFFASKHRYVVGCARGKECGDCCCLYIARSLFAQKKSAVQRIGFVYILEVLLLFTVPSGFPS